jgi:hypothetical protein
MIRSTDGYQIRMEISPWKAHPSLIFVVKADIDRRAQMNVYAGAAGADIVCKVCDVARVVVHATTV